MTQSSKKVLILSDFQQVFWPLSSVLQLHWDCLMPQHLPFRLGVSFAAGSDVYCSKFPYVPIQQFRAVNELFHARGARSVKVVHTSLRHPTTVCWLPRLPITCRTIAACFSVTSWSAGKGKGWRVWSTRLKECFHRNNWQHRQHQQHLWKWRGGNQCLLTP